MCFLSAVVVSSEDTLRDGLAALEVMRSPIVNVYGRDATPDHKKGIAHVQLTLDELKERKLRTDELCDVRRIKLQQLLQLKQSERDAEQVRAAGLSLVMKWWPSQKGRENATPYTLTG